MKPVLDGRPGVVLTSRRPSRMKENMLVLIGAFVGGILGYFGFSWLVGQGLYGIILPGGLVGIGAGIFKCRSVAIPIVCGLIGLVFGFFSEWRLFPFATDGSLGYFLAHLQDLRPITLLMVSVGGVIGFWIPFRRAQDARKAAAS